ncbi:hypothetical protein B5X24_HaOG208147 [Helicoverpa armigera]|uniref:Uncharacterized protein n=1 Tax=Helicoverpa armigera TaxID=29058 RepID=A0A2W1BGR0_HELAM|nr:hypothetical protein B5X24_HaOG208147 [Helicoverpa armigera]
MRRAFPRRWVSAPAPAAAKVTPPPENGRRRTKERNRSSGSTLSASLLQVEERDSGTESDDDAAPPARPALEHSVAGVSRALLRALCYALQLCSVPVLPQIPHAGYGFEISLAKLHPDGNLQVSGHIKLAARHITCRRHLPTYSMDISSLKKQIRGIIRVACAVGSPFAQDYEADGQSARVAPAPRASRRSAGP